LIKNNRLGRLQWRNQKGRLRKIWIRRYHF